MIDRLTSRYDKIGQDRIVEYHSTSVLTTDGGPVGWRVDQVLGSDFIRLRVRLSERGREGERERGNERMSE